MFRPAPMAQVQILLLRRDLDEIVRALASSGLLHLRQVTDLPTFDLRHDEAVARRLLRFREFEERLNQVMTLLQIEGEADGIADPGAVAHWDRWLSDLHRRLERIATRRRELRRLEERLAGLRGLLTPLRNLPGDYGELRDLNWARLRLGRLPAGALAGLLALSAPLSVHALEEGQGADEESLLVVLLTTRRYADVLDRHLAGLAEYRPLLLPAVLSGELREVAARVNRLWRHTLRRRENLEDKVAGLRRQHRSQLLNRLGRSRAERRLLQARRSFGFTERVVLVSGWVPRRRAAELDAVLREGCGDRYVLQQDAARGDETPVELANRRQVRPFQRLLGVYGTPRYGEIEPTPLLAVGFLGLFGMMFGDLGQGLVLVGLGWLLRRYSRFRDQGTIIMQLGCSAALFGLLFGSFFGFEELFPPLWMSPMHQVERLMAAALFLGVALILLGLLLRVRNRLEEKSLLPVLTDPRGVAGIVFYGGAVVTALRVWQGELAAATALWLLVPLAAILFHPLAEAVHGEEGEARGTLMLLTEGVIEVMETVLGYLANTFSFLRVAAFGLAHVGLFMAVFAMAERVQAAPLGDVWMVLVHILGNAVMIALEGLIVSVQAVRLQFYEFFSKFFQGGGVPFHPLELHTGAKRSG
jgi:V/A-type H+/Na+-transporting ATPase subunit I